MEHKGQDNMPISRDIPWKCPSCGFLLGVVSADRNTLRIKYKDFYVMISGRDAKVTELCRKCATLVFMESNQVQEGDIPQESKAKKEVSHNGI